MKIQSLFLVSIIGFFCAGAFAESGEAVTGLCKDGTSYTGASKKGACRGHKGIKEWYGDKTEPAKTAASKEEPAPAASTAAATGLCKDGTPYTGESKKGACRGHKGLKEWYADKEAPAAKTKEKAPTKAEPTAAAAEGPATGLCKDGTEYTGTSKKGACRGHKGVKEWYADKDAEAAPAKEEPAKVAPAAAAGTATGLCKDGTEYTGESKRGACRGHKGLKEWYADKEAPAAKEKATAKAEPADDETEAPAAPAKTATPTPAAGSGKVWVNTRSKIYHCEGSKFYGNTKVGEYMSETDAQAKGFVANRKKVCN